jgi:hypothetical protein
METVYCVQVVELKKGQAAGILIGCVGFQRKEFCESGRISEISQTK